MGYEAGFGLKYEGSADKIEHDKVVYEGTKDGSFHAGMEAIHALTKNSPMELTIDMCRDTSGNSCSTASYSAFNIGDKASKWKLNFHSFLGGGAGNSLQYHNNRKFTTKDEDNDSWGANCATRFTGAWWYGACHHSNLFGKYDNNEYGKGANWYHYDGHRSSVANIQMRIKHAGGSIDKYTLGAHTSLSMTDEGAVAWGCFGDGSKDCGIRTASTSTSVASGTWAFTVMGWIHKRGAIPSNEWWHLFTDGMSGDILTIRGAQSGAFRASMNSGSNGGRFTSGGGSTMNGPSGMTRFNDLSNGWHSLTIRYNKDQKTLALFVDGKRGTEWSNTVIDPSYKLRNFFGWGSSQSSYKYKGWFGDIMVHRSALNDKEVMTNHLVIGPGMLSGGKRPIHMRVFADSKTKPHSGFSLGPGWFSSTQIGYHTTKLDSYSSGTTPSWFSSNAGFDNYGVPDSWMVLGPFANGGSCTLAGGAGSNDDAPEGASLGQVEPNDTFDLEDIQTPKPFDIEKSSGQAWNLYKYNFVKNMVSECDECNGKRGIDLDCHWGGADKGDRMGYALTYVFADQDRTSNVRFGGNSYKVWVNGALIVDDSNECPTEGNCYGSEETQKSITFKKGGNSIVVQAGQAGVQHPSLSFLVKIDSRTGLRVSAHPGFDRSEPSTVPVSEAASGKTTWKESKDICQAKKMTLCRRVDLCPNGKLSAPVVNSFDGVVGQRASDVWLATSGETNQWTSIGNYDPTNRLCRTHKDSLGAQPSWSTSTNDYAFRQEVICCAMKDASTAIQATTVTVESYPMPKSTSWTKAKQICTDAGQLLCSKDEVCPDGSKTTPVSGKVANVGGVRQAPAQTKFTRSSDVWVPTRGTKNEWTSVGNYDPSNRLCRTHEDSLGSQPGWGTGTGNYNFRQEVLCCSPGAPAVKADQEPKEKTEEQVWDACASLDEKRAECAALMLEVSTSPMPETEGYCEKGTTFLDTIYKIRNQNTCKNTASSNRNIGFNFDIKFTLKDPVTMSFRYGIDFGYGGVV